MNTTPHPIDALALATKIERLIPGDPLAAELRRLHIVEQEFQQWMNKTEWVQKSAQSHELGMHRADVLKQRIDCLVDENNELQRHRATCIDMIARAQAEIAELKFQLESVGAGGVGPLMKSNHREQHLDMVPLPRPQVDLIIQELARYCNTGEIDDAESLLASLSFSIDPSQQPPTESGGE